MADSPESQRLRGLLDGDLPEAEQADLERELEVSQRLRDLLAELSGEAGFAGEFAGALRRGPPSGRERLRHLIEDLKAHAASAPRCDAWREIVTPDPSRPDLAGRLGPYEILEPVAGGGMSIVLKARDPGLERLVAVKALSSVLAASPTARERFVREARAAASVEHPNVLPIFGIHDSGDDFPVPCFAMAWAEGGSLEDLLERTAAPLPFALTLDLARQAAAGLEAAHAKGLVHRDIKPANLLLDASGTRLWIADFGIARPAGQSPPDAAARFAGTPDYMAPERISGGEAGPRSDLFSFGTLLYRCVTGRSPFAAATPDDIMRAVAESDPPPASKADPRVPSWFSRLLEALMAKDPCRRPASATVVRQALEKRKAPRRFPRRRSLATAAALAALAAATVLVLRQPAIAHRVNLAFAGTRPFIFADRLGTFPDLAGAIAAAKAGGTIEVLADGPHPLAPLHLPPGKPLAILAAPGVRPVFRAPDAAAASLRIESPLHLQGLAFLRSDPRRQAPPLIELASSSLTLDDCTLVITMGDASRSGAHPMLHLAPGSRLDARRSHLFALGTMAIRTDGPATISLDHSSLTAIHGVGIGGPLHLSLNRCAVFNESFLLHPRGEDLPDIRCRSLSSAFSIRRSLLHFANAAGASLSERVAWEGGGNLFFEGGALLLSRRDEAPVTDFAAWRALPFVSESGRRAPFPGTALFERHRWRIEAYTAETIAAELRDILAAHPGIGPSLPGPESP